MARKTERVVIGGTQYEITQLGAVENTELHHRFMASIEPLLRELISGPVAEQLANAQGEAQQMAALMPIVFQAFKVLPPAFVTELRNRFMTVTKVGLGKDSAGKPIMLDLTPGLFDDHFAGEEIRNYYAWFGQCVRLNGFLALLGGGSAAQAAASQAAP